MSACGHLCAKGLVRLHQQLSSQRHKENNHPAAQYSAGDHQSGPMNKLPIPLALVLLAGLVSSSALAQQPDDENQCKAMPNQAMVAHRGARADWPDNTLAAYDAAISAGASALEVDVRMTADGQLVAMHDPLVDRTTTGHGLVQNLSWDYLRQQEIIRAPSQRVPSLAQILEHVSGRALIMLDLKIEGETYWQRLSDTLMQSPYRDQVVLGVRSLRESKHLMDLLPGFPQLALSPKKRFIDDFVEAGVSIVRMWPEWLKKRPELGKFVQDHDVALYIPTRKNGRSRIRKLLCYQPKFIQTDDPVKLTATLEKLSAEDQQNAIAPQ